MKRPRCKKSKTKTEKPSQAKECRNKKKSVLAKSTTSSKETNPVLLKPKMGIVGPKQMKLCRNSEKLTCWKPDTSATNSNRAKLCTNDASPRLAQSNAKGSESVHTTPKVNVVLPIWAQLCEDVEGSRWWSSDTETAKSKYAKDRSDRGKSEVQVSITESLKTKPRRARPMMKTGKPSCARERTNMGSSRCAKPKTKAPEPKRAGDLTNNELPREAESTTNREETKPSRDKPTMNVEEPRRTSCRTNMLKPTLAESRTGIGSSKRAELLSNVTEPQ